MFLDIQEPEIFYKNLRLCVVETLKLVKSHIEVREGRKEDEVKVNLRILFYLHSEI